MIAFSWLEVDVLFSWLWMKRCVLLRFLLSTGLSLAWAFGCAQTIFHDIQIPDPCVQALEYFLRGIIPVLVEGIAGVLRVRHSIVQGGSEIGGIEWYQSWFELQWTMY